MGEVSSGSTKNEIVGLALNYLTQYDYDTSELRSQYNISDSLGTFGYTRVDSLAYKMYSISEISSTAKNYMLNLSSLLETVIGENDPNDSIYVIFANDAKGYENTINADNSISVNEKLILLSAYSVARFSAAYWGNYLQNNSIQEMSEYNNDTQNLFLKKFWKKIIGADAAGAVSGGGTALMNAKPVVKASIFGAIIGSVSTAVKELISPS